MKISNIHTRKGNALKPFLTVRSLKEKLDKKEVSPEEVLAYYHARFKAHDGALESALEVFDPASVLAADPPLEPPGTHD